MKKILQTFSLLLFVALITVHSDSVAQSEFVLKGKLIDELTNEPLTGAVIQIKGTSEGTMADDSGYYELKTKKQPPFTISVSAIGYDVKDVEVFDNEDPELNISVRQSSSLNEVVVTGYGEQKRKA